MGIVHNSLFKKAVMNLFTLLLSVLILVFPPGQLDATAIIDITSVILHKT